MAQSTGVESVRCFPRAVPPSLLPGKIKKGLQNGLFRFSFKQALTKLAEDGRIESWIRETEAEHVFQIQAPSNSLCCLLIGKSFCKLHQTDEQQTPGASAG